MKRPLPILLAVLFAALAASAQTVQVRLRPTKDRTGAVQDDLYGELVKRASAGLGEGASRSHAELVKKPDQHRGSVVAWQGVFLSDVGRREIEPVALGPGEAMPDVSKACEALVLDPVTGTTIVATFLEPGPKPAAHGRVTFEGAFWKVIAYRNKRGETVAVPYLVAKTWRLVETKEEGSFLPLFMAITGGLAVTSILLGAQASRRKDTWDDWIASAK